MIRRSRSSAGVVGQCLPVSRIAVSASFQEDSWEVIVGHQGQGSSETYRSRVFGEELNPSAWIVGKQGTIRFSSQDQPSHCTSVAWFWEAVPTWTGSNLTGLLRPWRITSGQQHSGPGSPSG